MLSIKLHSKQAELVVNSFGQSGLSINNVKAQMNYRNDRQAEILLLGGSKVKINKRGKYNEFYLSGYASDKSDVLNIINKLPIETGLKLLEKAGL